MATATDGRTANRARQLALLLATSLLVVACANGAAPSTNASQAAVTTPAPSAPTPSPVPPTPSLAPTQPPAPTLTPDDLKISALINAGLAKWNALVVQFPPGSTTAFMITSTKKMRTFFQAQVALSDMYTASPCTSSALALYRQGMLEAQTAIEAVLGWIQGGMVGDFPSAEGDLHPAFQVINSAVTSLQASFC